VFDLPLLIVPCGCLNPSALKRIPREGSWYLLHPVWLLPSEASPLVLGLLAFCSQSSFFSGPVVIFLYDVFFFLTLSSPHILIHFSTLLFMSYRTPEVYLFLPPTEYVCEHTPPLEILYIYLFIYLLIF